MIRSSLTVCDVICEEYTESAVTFALLKTLDMMISNLLGEIINNLLKRLNLDCLCQIVFAKCLYSESENLAQSIIEHRELFSCVL